MAVFIGLKKANLNMVDFLKGNSAGSKEKTLLHTAQTRCVYDSFYDSLYFIIMAENTQNRPIGEKGKK